MGSEGHRLPQGCTGVPAGASAEGIVWISLICIFSGVWDHLQWLLRGSCCWELDGFSLPCAVCDVRALLLEELLVPAESGESLDFPAAFCNLSFALGDISTSPPCPPPRAKSAGKTTPVKGGQGRDVIEALKYSLILQLCPLKCQEGGDFPGNPTGCDIRTSSSVFLLLWLFPTRPSLLPVSPSPSFKSAPSSALQLQYLH